VRRFSASLIREVANSAMGRPDVLPFWFGESDRSTPPFVRDAAIASLQKGQTFYTENLGRLYLRQAISGYLTALHRQPIGVERIAVTSSGVSALMIANQLIVQPGDRVVIVTPIWPNVVQMPKIMSAEVIPVPLEVREGRWALHMEKLLRALTPETRMLVLNSPGNPTGWTISREEQRAVFEHCRARGIWILADDVYERLVYIDGMHSAPSFLTLADEQDRVISVNSFSKAWSMTGWRAGWMVVPPLLLAEVAPLIEYNTSCVAEFVQQAAATALREGEPYVASMRAELALAKAHLSAGLRELAGVELPEADGAMYAFLRIVGQHDSLSLAKELIQAVGLGLAPGIAFGPEGEGWLRWCYAADRKKLESGVARLKQFLSR
ncbi:MAG TPA: pyridoxal phosphate-dependent aminotransferase, partial [Acidobacteriaceae bacterium]|nr:pyridoxal phosphate-dependent aminotransferase [Acidobacteriaceae bacterium]